LKLSIQRDAEDYTGTQDHQQDEPGGEPRLSP